MSNSNIKCSTASSGPLIVKEESLADQWISWMRNVGSIWPDGWRDATYRGEEKRQSRDVDLCKVTGSWWLSKGENGGEPRFLQADIYMKLADCSICKMRDRLGPHPWVTVGSIQPVEKPFPSVHLSPVNYVFQSTSGCYFTIGYTAHESNRKARMQGVSHAYIQVHKGAQRNIESENRNIAINLLLNLCGFYAHTPAGVRDPQRLRPPLRQAPRNEDCYKSTGQSSTEPVTTSSLPIEAPGSSISEGSIAIELPLTHTFSRGPLSLPESPSPPIRPTWPSVHANELAAIESIPDNASMVSIESRVASELVNFDMVTAENHALMHRSAVVTFASELSASVAAGTFELVAQSGTLANMPAVGWQFLYERYEDDDDVASELVNFDMVTAETQAIMESSHVDIFASELYGPVDAGILEHVQNGTVADVPVGWQFLYDKNDDECWRAGSHSQAGHSIPEQSDVLSNST